eukprot:scaffold520_cov224-Pinguiococcus_pyrenoidosus.AAC.5
MELDDILAGLPVRRRQDSLIKQHVVQVDADVFDPARRCLRVVPNPNLLDLNRLVQRDHNLILRGLVRLSTDKGCSFRSQPADAGAWAWQHQIARHPRVSLPENGKGVWDGKDLRRVHVQPPAALGDDADGVQANVVVVAKAAV